MSEHQQDPEQATEHGVGFFAYPEDAPGEDDPTTNIAVIREGLRRHGEPFLAYLVLDGVEQRASTLVEDFERQYYGHWPDRVQFIEHQVEELGWQDALAHFIRDNGIWPDELAWEPIAVWAHLSELYRLTERLGGVHVFRR